MIKIRWQFKINIKRRIKEFDVKKNSPSLQILINDLLKIFWHTIFEMFSAMLKKSMWVVQPIQVIISIIKKWLHRSIQK